MILALLFNYGFVSNFSCRIQIRDLSCNMLTGPIPPILGNLTYTEKL